MGRQDCAAVRYLLVESIVPGFISINFDIKRRGRRAVQSNDASGNPAAFSAWSRDSPPADPYCAETHSNVSGRDGLFRWYCSLLFAQNVENAVIVVTDGACEGAHEGFTQKKQACYPDLLTGPTGG